MTTGTITTLQRMSVHDGPGLRTVVFLKGCNMRCKWCHNPETWETGKQLQYIGSKCIGCMTCAAVCPNGVVSPSEKGPVFDYGRCRSCGICTDACCTGAVSLVGREVTAGSLWKEVGKDLPYFLNSGGGVTVSGGEPMLQKEFVRELLTICKDNNVSTAIETNMSVKWEWLEEISQLVDIWMCDLKMTDPAKHKEWTGLDNKTIIDNILKMAVSGRRMCVRTPVIPGVNDTEEEIDDICRLLAPYADTITYELLGFHTLGFSKFESMGINNELDGQDGLSPQTLERLTKIPHKYNL